MKVPHNMTTGDGKKKKQLTSGQIALEILKYVVLIVGAFVMLAPMLWMISTSLTADSVIFPTSLFQSVSLSRTMYGLGRFRATSMKR